MEGQRWVKSSGDYLFKVSALSQVFQAKFCVGLQQLYAQKRLEFHGLLAPLATQAKFQALVRTATLHKWVVYSKRPFAGPEQVLAYLSRYTHRVGITNSRLLHLDRAARTVTFDYKDYAQGARHKAIQLGLDEFIRRLRLHFLPHHFVKIRHYGLLANCGRKRRLEQARGLLGPSALPLAAQAEPFLRSVKSNSAPPTLPICPHCGHAALILVRITRPPWPAVAACDSS